MPRPSELAAAGREDLKQAMHRFGGHESIGRRAGMIPYQEWFYFEGQLELLLELKRYCDEQQEQSDYSVFPTVSEMRQKGYQRLYALIQYYGGRKFVALRLGMVSGRRTIPSRQYRVDMDFGPFDLIFGIRLLTLIREDQWQKQPPLKRRVIAMPSPAKLHSTVSLLPDGTRLGVWLHGKINEYGGYENVARRLGLALFE